MFRENGIAFEKVNYFIDVLTEEIVRNLLTKLNLKAFELLRKGDVVFKEHNLTSETPDDEIIELIVENPSLLQRPIVEVGAKAVIARPIEKALSLVNSIS